MEKASVHIDRKLRDRVKELSLQSGRKVYVLVEEFVEAGLSQSALVTRKTK